MSKRRKELIGNEMVVNPGMNGFATIFDILPDPDPILKNDGVTVARLRELTFDAHLYSVMQQRIAGTASLSWRITGGTDEQIRLCQDVIDRLELEELIPQMLEAVFYGYAVFEIMWEYSNGMILPYALHYKPQEWFGFDENNRLKLRTTLTSPHPRSFSRAIGGEKEANAGRREEELPEDKFLVVRYKATHHNPYGERVLSRCFWPVTFKKSGNDFWLNFIEKYGVPFLAAKYKDGMTEEDQKKVFDGLEKIITDTYGILPDSSDLNFVSSKSSTSEVFKKYLDFCNTEISKAVLSQTLTTEIVDKGSYAASATHGWVLKQVIKSDKRMIEKAINELYRTIFRLNTNNEAFAPKFELYDAEENNKALAERDQLLQKAGVQFSDNYFKRAYNLMDGDINEQNN